MELASNSEGGRLVRRSWGQKDERLVSKSVAAGKSNVSRWDSDGMVVGRGVGNKRSLFRLSEDAIVREQSVYSLRWLKLDIMTTFGGVTSIR